MSPLAPPPAGPSALAAPGCARLTGEQKVRVPLPGAAIATRDGYRLPEHFPGGRGLDGERRDRPEGSRAELLGLPGLERVIPRDGALPFRHEPSRIQFQRGLYEPF